MVGVAALSLMDASTSLTFMTVSNRDAHFLGPQAVADHHSSSGLSGLA